MMSNRVMDDKQYTEARLTNLEIKVSYTEDMVDELNKTIFRQQELIDMLVREITQLRQRAPDPGTVSGGTPHEPPPHY